jgi:hypothetical protein
MTKSKMFSVIGVVSTVIGIAAGFMADWADTKQIEEQIDKKVNEALAEKKKEEES